MASPSLSHPSRPKIGSYRRKPSSSRLFSSAEMMDESPHTEAGGEPIKAAAGEAADNPPSLLSHPVRARIGSFRRKPSVGRMFESKDPPSMTHPQKPRIGTIRRKPSLMRLFQRGFSDGDVERERAGMKRALKRGSGDGAYRAMLRAIRTGHSVGQNLRNALFMAGLLTDRRCYTEALAQFYAATAALEQELRAPSPRPEGRRVREALLELSLSFGESYEKDLRELLGEGWEGEIARLRGSAAETYERRIHGADAATLAAAAFILWGPLVIGGGPGLSLRIKRAGLPTNVFAPISSLSAGERDALKTRFADAMDGLASEGGEAMHDAMVERSAEFMALNNELMGGVVVRPWWYNAALCGTVAVGVLAVAAGFLMASRRAA